MQSVLKASFRHSALFLLILGSISGVARASDYEIGLFRQYVADCSSANSRYNSAPGGSFEERMADQQRRQAADYAKQVIQSPQAFTGFTADQTEALLLEFNSAYNSSPGGSILESVYDVARRAAAEGLKANAAYELQNAYDYNQALQLTLRAEQKYNSAPGGSLLESAYNTLRTTGYEIAMQKLRDYSSYQLSQFREAESLFVSFNQQFNSAPGGSRLEAFYRDARQLMHDRTIELFRAQAAFLSTNELNSVQTEYHNKFNAAPGGSMSEDLYRAIRDEARNRLMSGPGSAPYPYPPVHPAPGNGCDVRLNQAANGSYVYRVVVRNGGVIIATVYSQSEAQRIASMDVRCR